MKNNEREQLAAETSIYRGLPVDNPVYLNRLLETGHHNNPESVALASLDKEYNWSQLEHLSNNLAASYLALGIKPGEMIASYMPNTPELFIHYIACFKAGLVSVPLNYRYAKSEINQALSVADFHNILLCSDAGEEIGHSLLGRSDIRIIWDKSNSANDMTLEKLSGLPNANAFLPHIDIDSPCGIYFTSGTTGNPKGITHTHRSLGHILKSMIVGFQINANDTILPATHFSTYLSSLASLSQGTKVLVATRLEDHDILPLLRKYRATIFGMLPAGLSNLLDSPMLERKDFQSLRLCLVGGDKVSSTLNDRFNRLTGHELLEGYGMSECGISHNNPIDEENKVGSVGKVMPGFECSIRDSGKELGVGEVGELWMKSPSNMVGYWKNEDATGQIFDQGWLKTGDLMQVDEDGYYWFMGRKKQLIVSGGSNICPQEVEEVLMQHPAIDKAGVVGVIDHVYGQLVSVFISLKPGERKISTEEIIDFCRKNLATHKLPSRVTILEAMPITPAGKVDRVALGKI